MDVVTRVTSAKVLTNLVFEHIPVFDCLQNFLWAVLLDTLEHCYLFQRFFIYFFQLIISGDMSLNIFIVLGGLIIFEVVSISLDFSAEIVQGGVGVTRKCQKFCRNLFIVKVHFDHTFVKLVGHI